MERLKELRKEKGISQQKLADGLNVSRSTVAMWETQGTETDNPTLVKIAKYFDVSVDYLLGNEEPKENKTLTKKEKEIEEILSDTEQALLSPAGLMFDGEPATPEAVQSIIDAMRFGMNQARVINKKYTPKKYRNDD